MWPWYTQGSYRGVSAYFHFQLLRTISFFFIKRRSCTCDEIPYSYHFSTVYLVFMLKNLSVLVPLPGGGKEEMIECVCLQLIKLCLLSMSTFFSCSIFCLTEITVTQYGLNILDIFKLLFFWCYRK